METEELPTRSATSIPMMETTKAMQAKEREPTHLHLLRPTATLVRPSVTSAITADHNSHRVLTRAASAVASQYRSLGTQSECYLSIHLGNTIK